LETKTRRVRLQDFINYVEANYRKCTLNEKDYEIIKAIADNYSAKDIKLALDYCIEQGTDSLIYLKKTLDNKYYADTKKIIPTWMDEKLESEPIDEEDKEWCRGFYEKYCQSEEEYLRRIKEEGLG
jgi:hypothetical protein